MEGASSKPETWPPPKYKIGDHVSYLGLQLGGECEIVGVIPPAPWDPTKMSKPVVGYVVRSRVQTRVDRDLKGRDRLSPPARSLTRAAK